MATFDSVRKVLSSLEGVEEKTIHGSPALYVRGKLVVCPAIHKSAEPNSIVVSLSTERRSALLNANPRVDEAHHRVSPAGFKYLVTEMVCWAAGGPQSYSGRPMGDAHRHLPQGPQLLRAHQLVLRAPQQHRVLRAPVHQRLRRRLHIVRIVRLDKYVRTARYNIVIIIRPIAPSMHQAGNSAGPVPLVVFNFQY